MVSAEDGHKHGRTELPAVTTTSHIPHHQHTHEELLHHMVFFLSAYICKCILQYASAYCNSCVLHTMHGQPELPRKHKQVVCQRILLLDQVVLLITAVSMPAAAYLYAFPLMAFSTAGTSTRSFTGS